MEASEERVTSSQLGKWLRIGLLVLLALAAHHAFRDEYGYIPLLSDIDLAIHEFGHILFMPLGETMTILGGSLFQVFFPLIFTAYFVFSEKHRDPYAAMLCLWWAGINLLSVAIYAADARAGQLMLITGQTGEESDAHDWFNLLFRWKLLESDKLIASRMRAVAALTCIVSLFGAFAATWLGREKSTPQE